MLYALLLGQTKLEDHRDGSGVKCDCWGNKPVVLKTAVTPAPRDPTPSAGFCTHIYMHHTDK